MMDLSASPDPDESLRGRPPVFDHYCTACEQRQLIAPSQVTSIDNTPQGIFVSFHCWCGAEGHVLTGRKAHDLVAA